MRLGNLDSSDRDFSCRVAIRTRHHCRSGTDEWRQLTETTGFSWEQVNDICGAGPCSRSMGDGSFVNAAQ